MQLLNTEDDIMDVITYVLVGVMAIGIVVMVVSWYQVNKALKEYKKCEEEFTKAEKDFENALREYERYVNEAGDEQNTDRKASWEILYKADKDE